MTDPVNLLPPNATPAQKAITLAQDVRPHLAPAIEASLSVPWPVRPPDVLDFLVWEYGLGLISPYVENPHELLDEGIQWSRVRGTPKALVRGLAMLAYDGELEEAPPRRRFWNQFSIELGRIRDDERPDLARIEGIAGLTGPFHSDFRRGFRAYDARAGEAGWTGPSHAMWSDDSGVTVDDGKAKWSFGRTYDQLHTLTEAELTQLGVWIAAGGETELGWGEFTWDADPDATWTTPAIESRRQLMASGLASRPVWVEFRDNQDGVIGYRRAFSHLVAQDLEGPYQVDGVRAAPADAATLIYVEARTNFGDGAGSTAASAGLVFDATPLNPDKPGQLWCEPGEIAAGSAPVAARPLNIQFGETVREQVRTLLIIE